MPLFKQIFLSSLEDFNRNKLRTFLTSLGIMVGVSSVILLIALGLGLKEYIKKQFEGLGTNIVIAIPGKVFQNGSFRPGRNIGATSFDDKDIAALSSVKGITFLTPVFIKTIEVEAMGKTEIGDLYATNDEIFPMRNLELETGNYFTKSDVGKRSKKAVLGPKIAGKLFGNSDTAINNSVKLEKGNFRVIGVLKSKGGGSFGGPDFDSFIYTPYKSVISLNPNKKYNSINFQVEDQNQMERVKEEVKNKFLRRYDEDDFSLVEQEEIQNTVTTIYSVLNLILVAIGGISLIVGGIGIMNILYVSVIERYKEIGIRRAIGATRSDILWQFLAESVLLSLIGGILGLLLSSLVVLVIRFYFPAYIDLTTVIIALSSSTLIGIVFGVVPSRNAAFLSPVDAIRYE